MIYTLTVIACLLSAPTTCQTFEHPVLLAANPSTAYLEAQRLIVVWPATHDGLFVRHWRLDQGRAA